MLFSELHFWVFFAVVFTLYVAAPHRVQNRLLLVASYVFYGAWDWRFLGLILLSTAIDYLVALRMQAERSEPARRLLLMVSLTLNLGMLGIFKYLGFFVESFTILMADLGLPAHPATLNIILPVGISFFTFQTLSYTIDVYRRKLEPTRDFLDFALFVAFFPQLVAGPIERAAHLLPEIAAPRRITWDKFSRGAVLCLIGMIKKVVVADGVAGSVDAIYAAPDPSGADVLLATWLFAVQIYCDFSGYTDIARGVAKMLGFDLMLNFAQPYFSTNPQEFWRRWHISLSTWLRDYLYISLGGNRGSRFKTYRNLMATMLLGGLWHGAAWNFVLWGGYQGGLLSAHRAVAGRGSERAPGAGLGATLKRIVLALLFFQVVCYGWLLFRADSLDQIVDFTARLATLDPAGLLATAMPRPPMGALAGILFVFAWDVATEWTGRVRFYEPWPAWLRAGLWAGMIYLLAFGGATPSGAFIYFQF
ncbi:MBOAT family protein [Albimonas sp. CAU 1670]|uniref:MBOAT family O-acyltransferase n=1 Tax=Albimonas sp. CAU 1670 TaxID=3032599 RepID=UPI0023DBC8BD|nr:MBOAT family protein [Albimonas sp. CAU 1670]MDF2231636.1 MBOAT family protein [Albimonas sp. CAU 1670]